MLNVLAVNCDAPRQSLHRFETPIEQLNQQSRSFGVIVEERRGIPDLRMICRDTDVVALHRPYTAGSHRFIRELRTQHPRVGVCVQLDESVMTEHLWRSVAMADTVVVPEHSMIAHLPRRQVPSTFYVITDAVPATHLLDVEHTLRSRWRHRDITRPFFVGWVRPGASLDHLSVAADGLKTFIDGEDRRFRVIGSGVGVPDAVCLPDGHVESSGLQAPLQRRVSMSELDIAILPMSNTMQNRLTARQRVLELTAAGVPTIATALPELESLQKSGCPVWLVKNDPVEWSSALAKMLAMQWAEVKKLAESHREYVRRYATAEQTVDVWPAAWTAAHRAAVRRASRAVW